VSEVYIVIELSKVRNLEVVGSYSLVVFNTTSEGNLKKLKKT
jgi:hypothetical protein